MTCARDRGVHAWCDHVSVLVVCGRAVLVVCAWFNCGVLVVCTRGVLVVCVWCGVLVVCVRARAVLCLFAAGVHDVLLLVQILSRF